MISAAQWQNAQKMKGDLVTDGWVSPDTYDKFFEPVSDGPAVYLFMLHKTDTYAEALVAYVGMSGELSQRLSTHNILPTLYRPGYWPMRWFKPVQRRNLRSVESDYIARFNPPWNIVGRPRGVTLDG